MTTTEPMTVEHAMLILRRRAQGAREWNVAKRALRVLGAAGTPVHEIETGIQRTLAPEELDLLAQA